MASSGPARHRQKRRPPAPRKVSRPTGNSYASFGPDVEAQIQGSAAAIARYKRLTYHDREDLEQSIACRTLTALDQAPKGKPLPPLREVVQKAIEDCFGALDDVGESLTCERSLDAVLFIGAREDLTRADLLDHDAIRRRWTDITEAEMEEIRADIAEVMERLPVDLRRACEAIQFGRDSIEAARIARVRRSVLLRRLARAKPYFEVARARGAFQRFTGRERKSRRRRRRAAADERSRGPAA
jgi:hypothetical protein